MQEHFNDLVIATYGRGFWILDDITPLRQMTTEISTAAAHLFAPRSAYRYRGITPPLAPSYDPTVGQNPPYGADINYFLGSVPTGDVQIAILDAAGQTVRTLRGSKNAGINRVWWDLQHAPTRDVRLRTSPIHAAWLRVPAEGRPAGGRLELLAMPGAYTVKLSVGGLELTQPLNVIKDPHSTGTEADIRKQFTLLKEVSENIDSTAEMVNRVEILRRQLQDLFAGGPAAGTPAVQTAARTMEQKLTDFEENLYQLASVGRPGWDAMARQAPTEADAPRRADPGLRLSANDAASGGAHTVHGPDPHAASRFRRADDPRSRRIQRPSQTASSSGARGLLSAAET